MIRSTLSFLLLAVVALLCLSPSSAFAPNTAPLARSTASPSSTELYFFGQPKDDGKPGDYVCLDCGYVFTKGPKAWADLPNDWSCPPCGAVKRRFKKVPKGSAGKSK